MLNETLYTYIYHYHIFFFAEITDHISCCAVRWRRYYNRVGLFCGTFRDANVGVGQGSCQRIKTNLLVFLGHCGNLAPNFFTG